MVRRKLLSQKETKSVSRETHSKREKQIMGETDHRLHGPSTDFPVNLCWEVREERICVRRARVELQETEAIPNNSLLDMGQATYRSSHSSHIYQATIANQSRDVAQCFPKG